MNKDPMAKAMQAGEYSTWKEGVLCICPRDPDTLLVEDTGFPLCF